VENKEYDNLILSYKLPRVCDIPDLELYMDQVIIYVKKFFDIFPYSMQDNFITPSMINNYVKSGLIPAPVGKKYTRRHIAYIISVFFLKQIYSLEEIKIFMKLQIEGSDPKTAYENFCDCLEDELKACIGEKRKYAAEFGAKSGNFALRHAAISISNKLYSQSLIKKEILKK